jgi:hypothetical protein
MPYLVKITNRMLRAETASRVAERLRLDDRLLREELRRAAGAGQAQIQRPADAGALKVTPAERNLLLAFMEDASLADEYLPPLMEKGACEGLAMESIFRQILEMRRRGESLDVTPLGEVLEPEPRRLLFETLLSASEESERDPVRVFYLALLRRRAEQQLQQLQVAIQAAERQKDHPRLAELLEAKVKLLKELAQLK